MIIASSLTASEIKWAKDFESGIKEATKINKPDLFVLTANYQPQTSQGVFEFSQQFCEEMDKLTESKIKMYISAGAMVTERIRDMPIVHVCGTDQEIVESFLKFENPLLM